MGYYFCHIQKLPEDILLHILQSLPLVDALATRSVSQTWKSLWQKSCSQHLNLCFDVDNFIGVVDRPNISKDYKEMYPDMTYYRKNLRSINGRYIGITSQTIEDFIKGVGMILQCRRVEKQDGQLGVRSLEIRFPLRRKHSYHIDNWISSTVTSITRQLILVFDIPTTPGFLTAESDLYEFPFEVLLNQKNSSLEYLQLEFISTKLPQDFDGFTTLRTLKLNHTVLTQEEVHKLLISCPLLEFLKIEKCSNLVSLQVSSPLPHLEVLILHNCYSLSRIELWAENLSSFHHDTTVSMDHVMLRGCHNLTKVAVYNIQKIDDGYFRPLSSDFPFVTTLYLASNLKDLIVVLKDDVFAHLKFLAIFLTVRKDERNLLYLSSLLNIVAPMLEELELHIINTGSANCYEINNQRIDGDPFNHLKRVAFTGFSGEMSETMLAKHFLMKAKGLQIMTIDPGFKVYDNFDAVYAHRHRTEIDERGWKAYKFLCEEVPENTKLILVDNEM